MPRLKHPTRGDCWRIRVIAGLMAAGLMLAVALWRDSSGTGEVSSRICSAAAAVMKRGYFRARQWRADARTVVAAARWCFEPDLPRPGNVIYSNGVPALVSTNAVTVTRT